MDVGALFKTEVCLDINTLDCNAPTVAGEFSSKPVTDEELIVGAIFKGLIILDPGGIVGYKVKDKKKFKTLFFFIITIQKKKKKLYSANKKI